MTAADDEDRFDPPNEWRTLVVPRRRGRVVPAPVQLEPDRGRHALESARQLITSSLDHPASAADLVAAGRAQLAGTAATPLGAAVVATASIGGQGLTTTVGLDRLPDLWCHERGAAFMAEAVVDFLGIDGPPLMRQVPQVPHLGLPFVHRPVVQRARQLLATVDDADAKAVRSVLACRRTGDPSVDVVTSYLLPSELGWVAEDVDAAVAANHPWSAELLLASVSTVEQLEAVGRLVRAHLYAWGAVATAEMAATVADGVGPDAAARLASWLDEGIVEFNGLGPGVAAVVAALPTDAAFTGLLERVDRRKGVRPALAAAANRYPRRAARLLASAAEGGRQFGLFRTHVLTHPDAAAAVLNELPPPAAAIIRAELDDRTAPNPAPPEALPAILRDPPWLGGRKRPKPLVVAGLQPPTEVRCEWRPGEQDEWRFGHAPWAEAQIRRVLADRDSPYSGPSVLDALAQASRDQALPVLQAWRPGLLWTRWSERLLEPVVAAHEVDAHDFAVDVARSRPRDFSAAVAPYESSAVVELVVGWLEKRSLRSGAIAWLRRHPAFAADALIPTAVGKAGKARNQAGSSLRRLVDLGFGEDVRSAAAAHGDAAAKAVETVLATDPADLLPARIPSPPDWVHSRLLPPVRLAEGEGTLPDDAVDHLVTMLLLGSPADPYAGLERARDACDRRSLALFAWSLFEQWRAAASPTKNGWVFEGLGALGDDSTVAELLGYVREDTSDPRVVSALDSFVIIGTDAALLALKELSQKVKTKRVREGAAAKIADVAEGLGLTADQLADRLVPDLGLDSDGTTVIDFGARRFTVGFDELLRPVVREEDGTRLKDLPKPGTRDGEGAPEEATRFRKLKKDVKALGADQLQRLERAMVDGRRFSVDELRTVFVEHPLKWQVTRRLVWSTYDEDGTTLTGAIRVAEDRTFAGPDDVELDLRADTQLGVAHPLGLGDDLGRWSDLFADYQLLQPFEQLGRSTFTVPPAEVASATLPALRGVKIETVRFLGLDRRGWTQRVVGDGGYTTRFTRPLPGGAELAVDVEPGLYAGDPSIHPEQTVDAVSLVGRGSTTPTFASIGGVLTSEILRDLDWLQGSR